MKQRKQERDKKSARDYILKKILEILKVMEKKTRRNWTAEQTNLFCSILADPVTKFIFTLERKALRKDHNYFHSINLSSFLLHEINIMIFSIHA